MTARRYKGLAAHVRWLLVLVEATGADPETLARARMGDIQSDLRGEGWVLCLGNGGSFPMTRRLWRELGAWRAAMGLPPKPEYGDDTPLVQRSAKDPRPLLPGAATDIVERHRRPTSRRDRTRAIHDDRRFSPPESDRSL